MLAFRLTQAQAQPEFQDAREHGADDVVSSGPDAAEQIRELTGGVGRQWRVTEEHRPVGEIMQVRRIYTASAKMRRTINHQPQTEPASADEVLPYPVAS